MAENSDFNKDFYKKILQNLPEGVAICDSDNKIIKINQNFSKISGYSEEELLGVDIRDIIKLTEETCKTCPQIAETENAFIAPYKLSELKDRNDQLICVRVNQSEIPGKYTVYLVIPFSHIAFLSQAHLDFVSTVSHELRTPLTSIKGFADTLLSAGNSLNEEQKTRFIFIIKTQIDRLTRLVENLLTVSRIEARRTKTIYKAVDVKKAIESVLYSIQHKAKEHKIKINIMPQLPPVWADTDKFEQIMMNLIDNAIKYSKPGTTVNIDAKFVKNNSAASDITDMVEITVKDEGVGIPKEHLTKIFNKFSRIDNPLTREVQGTGLGLYITKSLVNSMKGDILAQSDGKGSVFKLTLPAASLEMQAKQKIKELN